MSRILEFCAGLPRKAFAAGDTVISQGDHSNTVYILVSGTVDVVIDQTTVCTLSAPGTVVGEIAPLLGTPRSANVKAVTPLEIVVVENINTFFEDHIDAALEVTKQELGRLFTTLKLLMGTQHQFMEAAQQFGVDLRAIPEAGVFLETWKTAHKDAESNFPFTLAPDVVGATEVSLTDGETLFGEDEPVAPLYVLKSGTVSINSADGAIALDLTKPETIINIGYELAQVNSMATAVARGGATVAKVEDVPELFRSQHVAGIGLLRQVAQRIVMLNTTFMQVREIFLGLGRNAPAEMQEKVGKLVDFFKQKEAELFKAILG